MDRADVGDHRHLGLGDRRQLGDLAGAAHRHLQHQQVGLLRRFEHGQRQPDLGVEVLAVGVDAAGQQRPGDVLDRGLADRAGDADDAGAERAPPGAGQRLQRRQRIRRPRRPSRPRRACAPRRYPTRNAGTPSRPARRRPRRRPRSRRRRTRRRRGSPRRPKKRSPGPASPESIVARAASPGRPRRRPRPRAPRRSAPRRQVQQPDRSSSRATSRSSKGILRPPSNSWPCSCPLPAITTVSPGSARPSASAIAARRSTSTSTPLARRRSRRRLRRRSPPDPRSAGCRR